MISLSLWDLFEPGFAERSLKELVEPAYFVPTQHPLVELLPVLRNRGDQAAIVVDKYGSARGMVTVDTILATVVGPMDHGDHAEYGARQPSRISNASETMSTCSTAACRSRSSTTCWAHVSG